MKSDESDEQVMCRANRNDSARAHNTRYKSSYTYEALKIKFYYTLSSSAIYIILYIMLA